MDNIEYGFNNQFSAKKLQGKFCNTAWQTITIVVDGGVYTCLCAEWTNKRIGNILTTPLEDIYKNSKDLHEIRDSIRQGEFGYCRQNHCNVLNNLPDKTDSDGVTDPVLPAEIYLGIDENCNLKCYSCRSGLQFTSEINPTVTAILDSLGKTYRDHKEKVHVVCDGSGDFFTSKSYENFLYSDQVPDCWEFSIITNGNLVSKRRAEFERLRGRFRSIMVSIDAGTSDTYKKIRGGNFEQVIAGLDLMAELKIPISLLYVLQAGNGDDLLEFEKIANKYNAWFNIMKIDHRPHMNSVWWQQNNLDNNPLIDYAKLYADLTQLKNNANCVFDGGTQWLYNKLVLDNR